MTEHRIEYTPDGAVLRRFLYDNTWMAGIRGPFGSGKSTASIMRLFRHASERTPSPPQGRGEKPTRRSRWAIIRSTYPELKTTTIKTWHQWFPRELGGWRAEGPPTHHIQAPGFDAEFLFLALESDADIKKLLSMDLTGAWVNEARELPYAVIEGLTGRVGRFPPADDGSKGWSGILMDTNSPDTEHWWYILAERDQQTRMGQELLRSTELAENALRAKGILGPDEPMFRFFAQPGGRSADAENVSHLQAGYYDRMMAGKREDWIRVYIDGEYGFVQDGRPVYPEYRDSVHCRPCEPLRGVTLHIGIDYGLTPAAVIMQRAPSGQVRVLDELTTQETGARRFGEMLLAKLNREFPGYPIEITGDPAGDARSQADDETTPARMIRAATDGKLDPRPAHTNDFGIRREAVAALLTRLIDGEPGLVASPRAQTFRKGMAGAYRFKKRVVTGGEQYSDKPDKNFHSHVCEAAQYGILGLGEGYAVVRPASEGTMLIQLQAQDDLTPRGQFATRAQVQRWNAGSFPDAVEGE